ncbi:Uncharacterised protein [Vibrio cholerae]|nr:Uncharacterised protein [Vibrio cholerae]
MTDLGSEEAQTPLRYTGSLPLSSAWCCVFLDRFPRSRH